MKNCSLHLIYVFICFVFQLTSSSNTDYCEKKLCSRNRRHIGCKNDNSINSKCAKFSEFIDLTSMQDLIVSKHNECRDQVSKGELKGFEPAVRMATMSWDKELAYLAGLNVKTCDFKHDKCRNTKQFKYSGQNLGYFSSTKDDLNLAEIIENTIKSWFDEYKDAEMATIHKFSPGSLPVGHFTAMISDKNTKVGCACLKKKEGKFTTFLIACNYARTNILGYPIYKSGKTAIDCQKGKNPKYPGLCNANEPIDPNSLNNN